MAPSKLAFLGAAAALGLLASCSLAAFTVPAGTRPVLDGSGHPAIASPATEAAGGARSSWGFAATSLVISAHAGLALAFYGRTALKAKEAAATKYVETAKDKRLFEQVYMDYTSEYLKGPMYWHEDKMQGVIPDYPGTPLYKNGKMTSNAVGNLKTFSSNELAFLSMLFFGIGLYGNIQFLFNDPQWARVDAGQDFNISYIVESLFLPISFFMHIATYIQKKNGK